MADRTNDKLIENFNKSNYSETDPEATFINLPEADFESALIAAAKPQYKSLSGEKNFCHDQSSVPERLAFELKKKAYAEGQMADENFSNYSDVPFDAKKLKKSASHESYKHLSRKSPSNFTSVHVDAAVNFPLIKKKSSLNDSFGKNERSYSENEPIFENSTDFENFGSSRNFDDLEFIVDETVPSYDEKSTKLRRVTKEVDDKIVSVANYGSIIDDTTGKFSNVSNRSNVPENDSEDVEMVVMHDLSKKAVFGRNIGTKSEEMDPLGDRTSGKRRSMSQRSGRSQEYNLTPSPFARYNNEFQSGLLLSELNPGCVTQKTRGYDFSSTFGRFSSPPPNTPHQRRAMKQKRNKRTDDDGNVCKAEDINGFRGSESLDSLLIYIEGPEATASKKLHTPVDDSSTMKKGGRRKEVKKEKAKKASSIGAHDDDDDDLTMSGGLESSKFLCKSNDNVTKYSVESYIFNPNVVSTQVDRSMKNYDVDDDVEAAQQLAVFDHLDYVVDEQFIPVTSKKQKKHRCQNDTVDFDGRRRVSAKRSITPPPRQKLNDKTGVGRRRRRNSYDSSPVNVDHSAMRREKMDMAKGYNEDSYDCPPVGDLQPSTSVVDKTDDVPTKLSYAIVVQRRPHSPTALSESSNEHSSSKVSSSKRQATSLNASRSNSPSFRTTSASATNQVNASSPDLKLFTDLPPLPSSSSSAAAPTPITITVSPGVQRTSYATVVTAKTSPNVSSTTKTLSETVPQDDVVIVSHNIAAASTMESSLIKVSENLKNSSELTSPRPTQIFPCPLQQQPCTSSSIIPANTTESSPVSILVGSTPPCVCTVDEKPSPSTSVSTTSQRRYSCPPMRSHVEFLDKTGRSGADADVPVIEGFTFGFEDLTLERNTIAEKLNISDNCDNDNTSIVPSSSSNVVVVSNAVVNVDVTAPTATSSIGVDIVQQSFAKDLSVSSKRTDGTSDVVLKTMVNYVNKKWNDFVRTSDIVYYKEN